MPVQKMYRIVYVLLVIFAGDFVLARAVTLTDVFAIEIDDTPGSGCDAIEIFSSAGIGFKYLYSLVYKGKGLLIFRTDNPDAAKKIINDNNLKWIREDELRDTPPLYPLAW